MKLTQDQTVWRLWPDLDHTTTPALPLCLHAVDGDTLNVLWPAPLDMFDKIRLLELDAPEQGCNGWKEARIHLNSLTHGHNLTYHAPWIQPVYRGRYNRVLAYVYADRHDIGLRMIANGFAWPYHKFGYGPQSRPYRDAFDTALRERRGLWKLHDPPQDPLSKRGPTVRSPAARSGDPTCN